MNLHLALWGWGRVCVCVGGGAVAQVLSPLHERFYLENIYDLERWSSGPCLF